jgi:hypothetical protein
MRIERSQINPQSEIRNPQFSCVTHMTIGKNQEGFPDGITMVFWEFFSLLGQWAADRID